MFYFFRFCHCCLWVRTSTPVNHKHVNITQSIFSVSRTRGATITASDNGDDYLARDREVLAGLHTSCRHCQSRETLNIWRIHIHVAARSDRARNNHTHILHRRTFSNLNNNNRRMHKRSEQKKKTSTTNK